MAILKLDEEVPPMQDPPCANSVPQHINKFQRLESVFTENFSGPKIMKSPKIYNNRSRRILWELDQCLKKRKNGVSNIFVKPNVTLKPTPL